MILLMTIPWTSITFGVCAVLAILGAVGLVTFTKPVYSALCLALVMISLAVIYASMGAPFLFAVQIIVYTGAVLMLFLFVVMLVGVGQEDSLRETLHGHRAAVAVVGLGILALLVLAVLQGIAGAPKGVDAANEAAGGNVQGLAGLIFSRYVVAFEVTAAMLITAAVAAMVMAHPEVLRRKPGQSERAQERLEAFVGAGTHPGPNPNSGVFARHNSIATPALLPDGSIAENSLSPALVGRVPIQTPDELWAPHDDALSAFVGDLVYEEEEVDVPPVDQEDVEQGDAEDVGHRDGSDVPAGQDANPGDSAEPEEPEDDGYLPPSEEDEKND